MVLVNVKLLQISWSGLGVCFLYLCVLPEFVRSRPKCVVEEEGGVWRKLSRCLVVASE